MPDPTGPIPGDPAEDRVLAALRGLSATLTVDPPPPDLATAVLQRLQGAPTPQQRRGIAAVADDLVQRLRRRWRAATAVAVALLLVLLAVTPAGARIIEWLGLGGVSIEQEQTPGGAAPGTTGVPAPGDTAGQDALTLDKARARVPFPLVVPAGLGPPPIVTIGPDDRVVSMIWPDGDPAAPGGPVRLDQLAGSPDLAVVKKYAEDVQFTSVDGADAFWLRRPHPLVYTDAAGLERTETSRTSAESLIWLRPGVTLRLEGVPDLARALRIAQSVE